MSSIRRTAESTIAFACEGALCASHRGVLGILATQLTFTEVSVCDLAIDPSDQELLLPIIHLLHLSL